MSRSRTDIRYVSLSPNKDSNNHINLLSHLIPPCLVHDHVACKNAVTSSGTTGTLTSQEGPS